jgi:hypothetical protein
MREEKNVFGKGCFVLKVQAGRPACRRRSSATPLVLHCCFSQRMDIDRAALDTLTGVTCKDVIDPGEGIRSKVKQKFSYATNKKAKI